MPDWRRIWDSADSCLRDYPLVTAFRRSIPVSGMRAILCGDWAMSCAVAVALAIRRRADDDLQRDHALAMIGALHDTDVTHNKKTAPATRRENRQANRHH